MAHILTDDEAVDALRVASVNDIANKELLLSGIDDDIKTATGHDWTQDNPIDPAAKLAASILLISQYDGADVPKFYYQKVSQLHAKALQMVTT